MRGVYSAGCGTEIRGKVLKEISGKTIFGVGTFSKYCVPRNFVDPFRGGGHLEDEGAAGGEGGGHLPAGHGHGVVPGGDLPAHSHRLLPQVQSARYTIYTQNLISAANEAYHTT